MASPNGNQVAATARRRVDGENGEYVVLTPERVGLAYDIAGLGSRTAAVLVDSLIQTAALIVLVLALLAAAAFLSAVGPGVSGLLPDGPERERISSVLVIGAIALVVLAFFGITVGYFLIFELVWNGQTPGKRLLGLRVIRENGYPIRPADAVVRNLVRIVDNIASLGLLVMLLNGRSRRLGDFAAGTVVVREGTRHTSITRLTGAAGDLPAGAAVPARLRPADATLMRDFLLQRGTLDRATSGAVARRLGHAIARRYGLEPPAEGEAERYLERLVAEPPA